MMWADLVIVLTAALVAVAGSLLGVFLVLRRQSMLSDAISHAALPGIVGAFWLSGGTATIPALIGAAVMGLLTVHVVLPPHPGIVGGTEVMGADVGMVLLLGLAPALVMWLASQLLVPVITRRVFSPVPAISAAEAEELGQNSDDDSTQSFPQVANPPHTAAVATTGRHVLGAGRRSTLGFSNRPKSAMRATVTMAQPANHTGRVAHHAPLAGSRCSPRPPRISEAPTIASIAVMCHR